LNLLTAIVSNIPASAASPKTHNSLLWGIGGPIVHRLSVAVVVSEVAAESPQ
jgi:hypothetical protein